MAADEGAPRLRLFEGYGIELEYMIVDRASLAVAPLADRVLEAVLGETINAPAADLQAILDADAAARERALHHVRLRQGE